MDLDSINVAHTWTEEQVQEKIDELLPTGWKFSCTFDPKSKFTDVAYLDADGNTVWSDTHPARNIVLLNSLMWLWLRLNPPSVSPQWSRGNRAYSRPQVKIPEVYIGKDVSEPGDLTPEDIENLTRKP